MKQSLGQVVDMETPERASAMGPVLFFGLLVYAFLTGSPVEPDYLNPAETMDMAAAGKAGAQPVAPARIAGMMALTPAADIRIVRTEPPGMRAAAPDGTAAVRHAPTPLPVLLAASPSIADPIVLHKTVAPDSVRTGLPDVQTAVNRFARPDPPRTAAVPAAPRPMPRPDWQVVNGDFVNLRVAPDLQAPSVTQLNRGTRGLRIAVDGDWSRVNFLTLDPPRTGWMASRYLAPPGR